MTKPPIRVLVIDDNEEDFIILKAVLSKEPFQSYLLENVSDLKSALKQLELKRHDIFLVDYRLGPDSGLEFLKKALEANCKVPVILLTGQGDHELDLEAMAMGAADFISKNMLENGLLERSIRYAVERFKSQEDLRNNEEFFRAVIENALDGIAILGEDGVIRYLSPSVKNILGYSVDEKVGTSIYSILHSEDEERVQTMMQFLLKNPGSGQTIELQVKHKNGSWCILEAMAKSNLFKEPFFQSIVVNFRDVTGRKRAERLTSQLATIVESSEDAIYSVTLDGVILSWNPGAQRIYGFAPEEARGENLTLFIYPDQMVKLTKYLEIVRDGKAVTNFVSVHRKKKGPEILLSMTLSPIRNLRGQVTSASVIARDITESEKAKSVQEMLQAERDELLARLQLQMERMPVACLLGDQDFNLIYWNPAAEKMFGYSFKEIEGKHPTSVIVHPKSKVHMESVFERIAKGDMTTQGIYSDNVRKDGTNIICEWFNTPLNDPDGHFSGIMSMVLDVTESRKAADVQSQLASILQQTPDAVLGVDLDGNLFSWNRGAESMFGYSLDEIIGQPLGLLIPEDRKDEIAQAQQIVMEGEIVRNFETLCVNKKKEPVDVSITFSPIKDPSGKTIGISAITRDITEIKKAADSLRKHEEQMRLVEKMNAIGRLAGGVAHDFNNLLSVIGGNAEFLINTLPKEDPHREEADEILKAVRRGADLTKQLLVFGQKQVSKPEPINLNELTLEMTKMFKRTIDANIDLAILPDKTIKPILADSGQMQQVLLNLVINARDAMPKGGNLILETKNIEPADLTWERRPTLPAGSYTRLTVTDTGTGIDPETQKRIFEPFFTTKAGKGTGLGLATVYGIVNKWSGHIFVQSILGLGSSFVLYFPALPETETKKTKPMQIDLIPQGSETVLLAEDEEPVRKILIRTLEKYGYRVLEAKNGLEAVQKAWAFPDPIHLLLTDTIMPKMNGKELADEIRKSRPKVKVIFISGYPREVLSQQGVLDPDIILIQKPFDLDDLVRQVGKTLHEK